MLKNTPNLLFSEVCFDPCLLVDPLVNKSQVKRTYISSGPILHRHWIWLIRNTKQRRETQRTTVYDSHTKRQYLISCFSTYSVTSVYRPHCETSFLERHHLFFKGCPSRRTTKEKKAKWIIKPYILRLL